MQQNILFENQISNPYQKWAIILDNLSYKSIRYGHLSQQTGKAFIYLYSNPVTRKTGDVITYHNSSMQHGDWWVHLEYNRFEQTDHYNTQSLQKTYLPFAYTCVALMPDDWCIVVDHIGSAKCLFFGKCFKKNYWIFSQISSFISKYNPSG